MIHWKNLDREYSGRFKAWFRREWCDFVPKDADGMCDGVGRSPDDDEPCDVCKVCDKHWTYLEEWGE